VNLLPLSITPVAVGVPPIAFPLESERNIVALSGVSLLDCKIAESTATPDDTSDTWPVWDTVPQTSAEAGEIGSGVGTTTNASGTATTTAAAQPRARGILT
jgi:hypothetical protein